MDAFPEEDSYDLGKSAGSAPEPRDSSGGAAGAGDPGDADPFHDVKDLVTRWRNEKFAPELLRFATEAVEQLSEVVEYVAEGLEEERANGEAEPGGGDACLYLLRCTDMDRVKYLLRDYLRIRLWKIRRYPQHYLEPTSNELLSKAEREFLRNYWQLKSQYLDHKMLCALPEIKQKLDDQVDMLDMTRRPGLDKHVYVRIEGDVDPIDITPSAGQTPSSQRSSLSLNRGETYLLRYHQVRQYLMAPEHDGKVVLV